jgi:hypothetical protein
MLIPLFLRKSTPVDPLVCPNPAPLEVAGGFDAFFSLEDFDPNLDWREALSAAWGVPYIEEE